ncbi:coiled-coil domain-containing protein 42 [Tyto alba]|uniref:coiled-coil domain-containing protein 42 n=1 Tax=Tyto alba TaxID=56313 RepID=UPI001C67F081|nr:coiled-coil domain-containing protein 42 [Tyto alba]
MAVRRESTWTRFPNFQFQKLCHSPRAAPGLTWGSSSARRTWPLWARLVAGVMATMGDEDLSAYFHMQYKQHLLQLLRKLGLTEKGSLSPFIRLQEKKKQDRLMQKALEVKEEAFREKMEVIACRWKDLHAKDAQLKTDMEKSGRILKENDKIRIQALKTAMKERERKIQKESELLRAKRELEALRNKHQKLSNKVKKYSIFNKYLEDVVKISQFEEIQEVIWRYKMPVRMHKDLLHSQQGHKEMFEQAKVLLDQYTAEKEAEILQYKNELVQLQLRFDQAQSDVLPWETSWADIQDTTAKKTLKLGSIKMAILSLFQCMSKQMKENLNVPMDDSHRQLTMIQQFIQDFTDISMEVKRNRQRASIPMDL